MLTSRSAQMSLQPGRPQPCLCDLTHLCIPLANRVSILSQDYAKLVVQPDRSQSNMKDVNARISPAFIAEFTRTIKLRPLQEPYWQGDDWRRDIEPFGRFIDQYCMAKFNDSKTLLSSGAKWRACIRLLGSARLMEEVYAEDWDEKINQAQTQNRLESVMSNVITGTYDNTHLTPRDDMIASLCASVSCFVDCIFDFLTYFFQANVAYYANKNYRAYLSYCVTLHTLYPDFWTARLNSSAVRLELANDTDHKFQFVALRLVVSTVPSRRLQLSDDVSR